GGGGWGGGKGRGGGRGVGEPLERRRGLLADRADAPRATTAEGAACRLLRGARQRTFEDDARAARVGIRYGDGGEERLGVRMKGRRENLGDAPCLHDGAEVNHRDLATERPHH